MSTRQPADVVPVVVVVVAGREIKKDFSLTGSKY
jgi:hypothetical protein